ncbi:MAG: protein kinase [Candidatus Didemnitutus sp.]|nr:protein kinase [Candidatus Didemnitutus sp.]
MRNREHEIFGIACELQGSQRAAFVEETCGEDGTLRARVEALLAAADAAGTFLGGDEVEIGEGPGTRIGPYVLEEKLGEGGFGVVYRAEQEQPMRRSVALKIIKLGMDTRAVVARFEAERQALALMDHPHIARVFDGGATPSGRPYFVMELVSGRPITTFCREERLGLRARLGIFLQVCRAVQHAHQKGIIHRDLKPSNMLVSRDGQHFVAKVIDFGIAKAAGGRGVEPTSFTRLNLFVGTPAYMSPEQLYGASGGIDTRSDVFSLGAVLHELLVGLPPFDPPPLPDGSTAPLQHLLRRPAPVPPSQRFRALGDAARLRLAAARNLSPAKLAAELHGDLDQIVLKSLETDRAHRYDSAEDLARDILNFMRDEPVSAQAPTMAYRCAKFVRRHTSAVLAVLAGFAVLGSLTGYYAHRIAAERDRARLSAQRAARVSGLLTGLLAAPDPFRAPTKGDPMAGLFASTVEQAKRELADEPALRLQVLAAVGRVYLRLGNHREARAALTEALATGVRDENYTDALVQMGVLAREEMDFGPAKDYLTEALSRHRAVPNADPLALTLILIELGRVQLALDEFETAAETFRALLEIHRKFGGEENDVAVTCFCLSQALWYQGQLAEAHAYGMRGYEITRRVLGGAHPNTALSLAGLALTERELGDFAAADRRYAEALPILRQALGSQWRTARLMGQIAGLRSREGRLDEADALLREAQGMAQANAEDARILEPDLKIEAGRVQVLRHAGAAAEPLLRDALVLLRRSYPEGSWRVCAVKSLLGSALTDLGRYAEAETLLKEAERGLPVIAGPCGNETAPNRERLARLYAAWGKTDLAARYAPPSQ